jgi:hypothetical protein
MQVAMDLDRAVGEARKFPRAQAVCFELSEDRPATFRSQVKGQKMMSAHRVSKSSRLFLYNH